MVVAVVHGAFKDMGLSQITALCSGDPSIVIDVKGGFDLAEAEELGVVYWRL